MKTLELTKGYTATVDDDDFARVSKWKWQAAVQKNGRVYAQASNKSGEFPSVLMLHRVIMGAKHGVEIDHIDGDCLNNCRANLRPASTAQNQWNVSSTRGASKYKGVSYRANRGSWRAGIRINGKRIYLGCYKTELEAHLAYKQASLTYHGEFSPFLTGRIM